MSQALRDAKTNENLRKVKSSSYKCLGYSEPTHKVPTASPRDREQPPLYPVNHISYPTLRGQVSSGGVNVISPNSCLLFYISFFFLGEGAPFFVCGCKVSCTMVPWCSRMLNKCKYLITPSPIQQQALSKPGKWYK